MIAYTIASTEADLQGIIALQKANLAIHITVEEASTQGFVTVIHSYQQLENLNNEQQHIIAKDGDKVIGYLLCMTQNANLAIPVLIPMFAAFNKVIFRHKFVAAYNYIVVGQVCIHKMYRGAKLLDAMYAFYKNKLHTKYDFAITEIDATNLRSINAHKRIGFEEISRYTTTNNTEWIIVMWNWNTI